MAQVAVCFLALLAFLAFLTDKQPTGAQEVILQIERPATVELGLSLPDRNPRRW